MSTIEFLIQRKLIYCAQTNIIAIDKFRKLNSKTINFGET
jgi:hypothetical protein